MKLQFLGAARTVTGSRTLVKHGSFKLLVDCGLFQGPKSVRDLNWQPIPNASEIDAVILTHAHIDHSGYLPRLVKDGFRGPIYCTSATWDLCKILLMDAAHLQEEDALFANQSGYSHHKPALPLYNTADVGKALNRFVAVSRDQWTELTPELSFRLIRSGHILGSSFVQLAAQNGQGSKKVLFTGDLGNGRSKILKPPVTGLEADVLVMESTYGDRLQPKNNIESELAAIVNKVASREGVLLIPAFSVGRTQEILFELRQIEEKELIPKLPVYVDSPMANHATELFFRHPEDHQPILRQNRLETPICPSCFQAVGTAQESIVLTMKKGPMIVISAAGMLTGGRIMHHLKRRLPDEKNAVLFVGYQARETKGRLLQDGIAELRIHHQPVPVRAEIITLDGLSAHADADDLIEWTRALRGPPKKVFLNHGDNGAPDALAKRLKSELELQAVIPALGEEYDV